MANLRILYNNLAATATLTSATAAAGYPVSNLLVDKKASVWRSVGNTTETITLTWTSDQTISAVILPFTNMLANSTMAINLFSDTAGTVGIGTYTAAACVPSVLDIPNTSTGSYVYSYGGGSLARRYITKVTNCRRIVITLTNTSASYIEVSRILVGDYWSPQYNTELGLQTGVVDTSNHIRTQSGDLITDVGASYRTLSFSLPYMRVTDRDILFQILRGSGKRKAMFISLFPEDTEINKEYIYSIYGRLSNLATITHPMYTQYTSSIEIEEI